MKFEIDVPENEAVEFALALSELAEDFGIPRITETTYATAEPDDEEDDETDPCIILPGGVVELDNGLVYQVFSIDATGRVILDLLTELDDCEDSFFSGPRYH